jgi:hypothetical protein
MEFMQNSGQARTNGLTRNGAVAPGGTPPTGGSSGSERRERKRLRLPGGDSRWSRIGLLILLFAGTILVVASLLFLAFGKGIYKEKQFVDKNALQAVFINVNGTNGGQVYFGNVVDMTQQYIRLTNVFYIQNQQSGAQSTQANSAYNLVKLGCELHGPQDEMLINRSEVFFWENLKGDSQVAQKVAEFHKQNPNGQKCTAATAGQTPATTLPASTDPSATVTPSTGTTTKR